MTMDDIFELYPDKDTFDAYWKENYQPVTYEDVRIKYEEFVQKAQKHIFISDYEAANAISREDFMENLSEDAQFLFQDVLTEVFYDKNPDVYETAFTIFEEAQISGNGKGKVAETFHQEYERLYKEFMNRIYDQFFA